MKFARYRRDSEYSYAQGATLVFELLKTHPENITRIFLRPNKNTGEDLEKILETIREKNIEIIENDKPFNVLNAKENCLLIAEFKKDTTANLDAEANHLLLVNPSDAGNLGTIMRSCIAFGVKNLAIIPPAVDHFDPKVIRASMGAIFHLNIQIFKDFKEYQKNFPNHQKFAFILNKQAEKMQKVATEYAKNQPFTLIFGNEASGLPKEFSQQENCKPVFIEQSQDVDSLNLSIAASLALYLFTRTQD